jgi:hypothetical protein
MASLIQIIRDECMPYRNCMLTLTDRSGETGFIYFKDAQLIEANSGAEWGMDALRKICDWEVASHGLSELPYGIKRTLWEPVDKLFDSLLGTGAGASLLAAVQALPEGEEKIDIVTEQVAPDDPMAILCTQLSALPGFISLVRDEGRGMRLLEGSPMPQGFTQEWLEQFDERLGQTGAGLGAGALENWLLELADSRLLRFRHSKNFLILRCDLTVLPDDFESGIHQILRQYVES